MTTFVARHIFPATFALLPANMDTPRARAMMLAIGLQESKFIHRVQQPGPARGFYQFERGGGVVGVLRHPASSALAVRACHTLRYEPSADSVYTAIAHNDVLSSVFARLLLWTDPERCPERTEPVLGWLQYLRTWRPGKPHPETWNGHFAAAWALIDSQTLDNNE